MFEGLCPICAYADDIINFFLRFYFALVKPDNSASLTIN